jgi:hypothetical protein
VLGLNLGAVGGYAGGGGSWASSGVAWSPVLCGAPSVLSPERPLYGLFVGNVLSARQPKKMVEFVPPNSSPAFLWADGDLTDEAIDRWAPAGSQRMVVRFDSTPQSIVWVLRRTSVPCGSH